MTQDQHTVPAEPVVTIEINQGEILVDGQRVAVREEGANPYVTAVHAVALQVARVLGRPVRAMAVDEESTTHLIIHPDGSATEVGDGSPAVAVRDAAVPTDEALGSTPVDTPVEDLETTTPWVPAADRGIGGLPFSFVRREVPIAPAEEGWRGLLNRVGLRLAPSAEELEIRTERDAVSEFYVDSRTIAVANPKGGSCKTPSAALLAAVFAAGRGGNVLAFDLNETRGSLGWRTQQGRHAATVLDLLPQIDRLSAIQTQAASLARFTHHQLTDKYDVLQSDQSVGGEHEMSADDVARVHQLVSRFWGLVICDSGNSERAANWRAMIDRADALVVPCTNSADTAEGARLMLEALKTRDDHSRDLAARAVVIVSQRDRTTRQVREEMHSIVAGMEGLAAAVVTIPFDPAMQEGVLHFKALRPATRRAWLSAGAAVARAL